MTDYSLTSTSYHGSVTCSSLARTRESRPRHPLLLALVTAIVVFATCSFAAVPVNEGRILLFNSYHQGFQWTDELTREVFAVVADHGSPIEIHVEYMDSKRVDHSILSETFVRIFSLKYNDMHPDVIIVSDDDALQFMLQYQKVLFPGTPVVFCGINAMDLALSVPQENFSGLVETLDIEDNIRLVLHLFPYTREIVVISDGTPTGLGTRQMAMDSEQAFEAVTFTYFNGEELATSELLEHLQGLGNDSVVIAPAWYRDRNGQIFDNTEIYPLIAAAAPVPVIITSSANLGLGPFGGKVNSGATQGRYAAQQALRLLTGEAVSIDIGVEVTSHNRYMFDSRQLIRFGIEEKHLPADSMVFHRQFSFYQTYKYLVWSVLSVFALFTLMIGVLLVTVHRLREARSSLVRSEQNLRITLHSIGDAVMTTDTAGRITRMNPVAETLTGWSFEEASGRPLTEILHLVRGPARDPVPDPVVSVLAAGGIMSLRSGTVLIGRNGSEHRVTDSGAPLRGEDGEVMGTVLVFRDITEEYLRQSRLNQNRRLEAVGQLAGGVAHDFNNMLGGIIGSAEMLALHLEAKSPLHSYLDIILNAAGNAAVLTRKLLTFSRKEPMTVASMDVHKSLKNVLALLERSLDKTIIIKREFNAVVSIIEADSAQIENSLVNLCINAAQSMTDGGVLTLATDSVELDARFCQASPFAIKPGSYVRIDVRDTGAGIPSEIRDRIFEPFFTTKDVGQGTGLGLSAVYGTVQEHHGCLTVESQVGVGSLFSLYVPASTVVEPGLWADELSHHRGSGCILVVDDEQVIRMTAASILEELGYRVLLAGDGVDAVAMYRHNINEIDLVLLDLVMPRMGGAVCFREIRAIHADAKVVISSGFSKEDNMDELWAAGVRGFIQKPYRRQELARTVARALNEDKLNH